MSQSELASAIAYAHTLRKQKNEHEKAAARCENELREVSAWLRLFRFHNRISQKEVAKHAEVTSSFVSQVETGQRPITPALLSAYERAYDDAS